MSIITKEWLQQAIAEYESNRDELPFGLDTNSAIELQAFKLALASLEAEPVAYIFKHPAGRLFWSLTDESNKGQSDVMPVYTAQPAPVSVPDEMDLMTCHLDGVTETYADGWNACRAAMLQGADGNSPVLPDGWVACSERMPEGMTDVHISNGHDVGQGWWDGDTWQTQHDYYSVPGEVTHWMPLPAAPQQDTSRELFVSVEGDSCGKHPDTQLINHPHRQTASIPPHPVKYCPKCEPGVLPLKAFRIPDEWIFGAHTNCLTISCSVKSDKKITFVNSSFVNCSEPEGDIQFINCTLPAEWEGKVNAIDCVFKAAPQQEVKP